MKKNFKASLVFIFFTIALDSIGFGIVIPVMPTVIRRFISDEAMVSQTYGYFVAIYALMQFLSSPWLGSLADRFGRRIILLFSLAGAALDYFLMALAPSLPLLFIGRLFSGMCGASYTVASAYIADISNNENRAKNFGVLGAGFGLGFIVGPAIGGLLAHHDPRLPFLVAGGFTLLNFAYGFFILPESLASDQRRPIQLSQLNPFSSLSKTIQMPAIRWLVFIHILLQLAGQTHPSIWTLYTQHRYHWSATEVGLSLAMVGVMSSLSQGMLTGWIVKTFGEKNVLLWGTLGEAFSFALFGLATQGYLIYIILIFSSVFWAAQPALQSLISREVAANQQGELQGSLMSLSSLVAVINPVVMTTVFAFCSNRNAELYLPGAPYLLASGLLFLAWAMMVLRRKTKG